MNDEPDKKESEMNEGKETKTVMVKWGTNGYVTLAHPLASPKPYDGMGAPAIVAITGVPADIQPRTVARLVNETAIFWKGGMPKHPEVPYALLGSRKLIWIENQDKPAQIEESSS